MKLIYHIYECVNCKNKFKAPELRGDPYGEFLMRSEKGDIAYLDSMGNKIFDEFSGILKQHPSVLGMKDLDRATIFQEIFGYACDISFDGTRYGITTRPNCPVCGEDNPKHWGPTNPPAYVEMDVKSITHEAWNKLQWEEKKDVVNRALGNYFNQEKK